MIPKKPLRIKASGGRKHASRGMQTRQHKHTAPLRITQSDPHNTRFSPLHRFHFSLLSSPPLMAASATLPANQLKRSPHRTSSCPDQFDGTVCDLDSVANTLFCGDSGYGNITRSSTNSDRALRRRGAPDARRPSRQRSFGQDIGHAAAETYLITRLSFKLLRLLGVGSRWITRLLALACYAMLLLPGFIQVGYYYYFSNQVRRSIVYGDLPRNRLDLYLPADCDGKKPVVVFVTGGAWIIGYKAWGALLGRQLAERDIIVASIDYRNFPQGTISDMVKDVSEGISFVCNHIPFYGGDANRIYLMGQSAGAHISACALVKQAIKEAAGESISWSISHIKGYFGVSGGYNLIKLVDHFHKRGLYRSIFLSIMEGEQSLEQFSPEIMIQDKTTTKALSLLPPFILFHGNDDLSIPPEASKSFSDALNSKGVHAELVLYDGKTHTDLFLQDPLRGGKDPLFDQVVAVIHSEDQEALARDAMAPPRRRLVPELLLQLAHRVSPF